MGLIPEIMVRTGTVKVVNSVSPRDAHWQAEKPAIGYRSLNPSLAPITQTINEEIPHATRRGLPLWDSFEIRSGR